MVMLIHIGRLHNQGEGRTSVHVLHRFSRGVGEVAIKKVSSQYETIDL